MRTYSKKELIDTIDRLESKIDMLRPTSRDTLARLKAVLARGPISKDRFAVFDDERDFIR